MTDEFCIEWVKGQKVAGVSVPNGSQLKNRLLKLAQDRPDEVEIYCENDDGSICQHVPVAWVKISNPKIMSEENKAKVSERFQKMWDERKKNEK